LLFFSLIHLDWNAALIIILNGTKPEHLDMLDGGIIERLLEEKWKTFAQQQFLKRLLILFIHLFFMSISVYTRPKRGRIRENDESNNVDSELVSEALVMEEQGLDVQTIIRYCCECATIIGVISFVVFQQGDELKNQGLKAFVKQLKQAPAKAIFLVSNLLILVCSFHTHLSLYIIAQKMWIFDCRLAYLVALLVMLNWRKNCSALLCLVLGFY
jgi:transient receptor potential cation channel subfamily V member 6